MRWHENSRQHDEEKEELYFFSFLHQPHSLLCYCLLCDFAQSKMTIVTMESSSSVYIFWCTHSTLRNETFYPLFIFFLAFPPFSLLFFSRSLADITTHLHIGICMSERFFAMHARLTVGDKSFSVCSLNSCIIVNIDFLMNDFCRLFAFLCLSQKWNGRIWMEIMKIDTKRWRWWDNERGGGGSLKNRIFSSSLLPLCVGCWTLRWLNDAQDIHEFKLRDKREK